MNKEKRKRIKIELNDNDVVKPIYYGFGILYTTLSIFVIIILFENPKPLTIFDQILISFLIVLIIILITTMLVSISDKFYYNKKKNKEEVIKNG